MTVKLTTQRAPQFHSVIVIVCLAVMSTALFGCGAVGWAARVAEGERDKAVKARYLGLENKTVAVLVAGDDLTLYRHPEAIMAVCRSLSRQIADKVPGVTMTDPGQISAFQKKQPFWTALPYSQLVERFNVDRLIVVDLVEYRTHEPGNKHIWQGLITANIGVVEADSADPDNFAFFQTVSARFPQETQIGAVNADSETIKLGMLTLFTRDAAGLFHDYVIPANN